MADPTIACPKCGTEIKLTESLAAPLVDSTRRDYEQRLAKLAAEKDAHSAAREKIIHDREELLRRDRETLDQRLADQLRIERSKIAAEESKKARIALANDLDQKTAELAALQLALQHNNAKLAEAQNAQADLLVKSRQLDDARREMELTIQTRVQALASAERDKGRLEAQQALTLKVAEREQVITAMQRQIEELKRKSEQGSQQLQGEVLELQLEALLAAKFPLDRIDLVPKGEHGGDLLQRVAGPSGQPSGTILWETKRTKNWSDGWLAKLRDDQRAAKADLAVILSQALPKGVDTFDHIDGIWVVDPRCALPVAIALRLSLIEVSAARQAGQGRQSKMEQVYQYLAGPRFRHRIQAIVEKFTDMQSDLDKERKAMTRLWAKREEQLHTVLDATAGLYGDLQGIAGKSFQEIEGLEFKLLESPPN